MPTHLLLPRAHHGNTARGHTPTQASTEGATEETQITEFSGSHQEDASGFTDTPPPTPGGKAPSPPPAPGLEARQLRPLPQPARSQAAFPPLGLLQAQTCPCCPRKQLSEAH